MKRRLIRALLDTVACLRDDDRGSALILFAVSLPVLLGFAALAVDGGRMYATKADLQKTADAAALAGASALLPGATTDANPSDVCTRFSSDKETTACRRAIALARSNMPPGTNDNKQVLVDHPNRLMVGCWLPPEDDPGGAPAFYDRNAHEDCQDVGQLTAVKVITERANRGENVGDDNPLRLFLARAPVIGEDFANVRASAVAALQGGGGFAPCFFARTGDFIIGSNSTLDLPDCVIATNERMNVKGNAKGLQRVAGVTYRDYDGGTGQRDHPDEDFDDAGDVRELGSGERLPEGEKPENAKDLNEVCGGNGKYTGNNDDCFLDSGVYVVEGDLEIGGNAEFSFPGSGESARIYVTGQFKVRGTSTLSGCLQMSAANIDFNGNPFGSSPGCDDDQTQPLPGTAGQISLVQ